MMAANSQHHSSVGTGLSRKESVARQVECINKVARSKEGDKPDA
jgi:hypothetical protein